MWCSIAGAFVRFALTFPATAAAGAASTTTAMSACSVLPGTDCSVPDIATVEAASADECCRQCSDVSGCAAFTFKGGVCHLKQHCNYGMQPDDASSSGFLYPSTCSQQLLGTACLGEDVETVYDIRTASVEACCGICGEYFGCAAFTYKDGKCHLKSGCSSAVANNASTSGIWDPQPVSPLPNKCSATSQSVSWPRFNRVSDLRSSKWASYFRTVYGALPSSGYPICTSDFWFLHREAYEAAGIGGHVVKNKDDGQEHIVGDLLWSNESGPLVYMQGLWIFKQRGSGRRFAGSNEWIEVRHRRSDWDEEVVGMWLLYAPGSGVWFNTGRSAVFETHDAAAQVLCGSDHAADDAVAKCARNKGELDSYQFNSGMGLENYLEIVVVHLAGRYPCGTAENGTFGGFRAGWQHESECHCDNGIEHGWLNCRAMQTVV